MGSESIGHEADRVRTFFQEQISRTSQGLFQDSD